MRGLHLLVAGAGALGASALAPLTPVPAPPVVEGAPPAVVVRPVAPVLDPVPPVPRAPWAGALEGEIRARMAAHPEGRIGVFVHDVERGHGFGLHDDEPMYLASGVKVLFMVELFRQREAGLLSFDEELFYGWADVRDGAPAMNRLAKNKRYPVEELLLYMLRDSDNAAADLIAHRVGLDAVQRGLVQDGFPGVGPLVDLMDVRREVYRRLDPRADELSAAEVRDVRWRDGFHPRLDILKRHIGPPYGAYGDPELDAAYDAYYRLGRNHAPLRTIGALLERMWRRELVSEEASEKMLERLLHVWSSGHRIRGAIPAERPVHHKTGTQHERICDLALVELEDGRPLIIAIAVEGLERLEAEPILAAVAKKAYELATSPP